MCLGIPGEVMALHEAGDLHFAQVRFGGITRQVCLEYALDAQVGDFVLVHVGFAIARIDRDEAARAWEALEQMGGLEDVAPPPDSFASVEGER